MEAEAEKLLGSLYCANGPGSRVGRKSGRRKRENAMKRFGILLATTALGAALVASTVAQGL